MNAVGYITLEIMMVIFVEISNCFFFINWLFFTWLPLVTWTVEVKPCTKLSSLWHRINKQYYL